MKEYKEYTEFIGKEIATALEESWLILPVGSVEQHGINLALSVDIDITREIAKELCRNKDCILAPEIVYGVRSYPNSGGGQKFNGNVYLDGCHFIDMISDIVNCYIRNGANKILILNGHFENYTFLCEAVERISCSQNVQIVILNWWDVLAQGTVKKLTQNRFQSWEVEHAGIVETALEQYLYPLRVKGIEYEEVIATHNIYCTGVNSVCSQTGALSSNIGATSKMGKRLFQEIVTGIVTVMENKEGGVK